MGQNDTASVTERYGLARVDRERRWTWIVDGVLLLVVAGWVVVQRDGTLPGGTRVAVSIVLSAALLHRGLLLLDRRRRRRAAALVSWPAARRATPLRVEPVAPAATVAPVAVVVDEVVTPQAGPQVA